MESKEGLQNLQDELIQLKRTFGKEVIMKKSKSDGEKGNSPFPVTIRARVAAPEAAARYDVGYVDVCITVGEGILRLSGRNSGAFLGGDFERDGGAGHLVEVRVTNEDIPDVLRQKIGDELESYWRKRVCEVKEGFFLEGILMRLKTGFVEFLLSVPECIEAYESVDESGATVRRFAIVTPAERLSSVDATFSDNLQVGGGVESEVGCQGGSGGLESEKEVGEPEGGFDEPLAKEISMLKLRFSASNFKVLCRGDGVSSTQARFSVSILPSDPDWEEGPLDFLGELEILDSGSLGVSLQLAPMAALQWYVRLHVERAVRKEAEKASGRADAGRVLLKFIEGHIAEVVRKGEESFMGSDEVHHLLKEVHGENTDVFGFQADHCSDVEAEDSNDEAMTPEKGEDNADAPDLDAFVGEFDGASPLDAFGVELEGLQLDNIDIVEGLQMQFQVACSRCKKPGSMQVVSPAITNTPTQNSASWDSSGSCPSCHDDWSISAFSRMIHESSNLLCRLKPHNCIPVDLLPSHFMVQCVCGSVTALRGVQVGSGIGKECNRCRKSMTIKFASALFTPETQMQGGAVPKKAKPVQNRSQSKQASDVLFQVPIKAGEPLPDKGTCRHYRHSHRWLRFPCCGMRFPCDLCHEEHTDGHNMKWALRMVCGYCSLEQKLGDRCMSCSKKLATTASNPSGRNTQFWEGGQGCRDKNRLDRRDKHKYSNSKHKTQSNKASRVGPKNRD